jgi:hypothetical protein
VADNVYFERLQMVIAQAHKCDSRHVETVNVEERFQGQTVWQGDVEVFDLIGHVKASRCYAWAYKDDSGEHVATVLGIPPVRTAIDAVRVHIVAEAKKRQGK